jgi:hypothetical protein
MRWGLAQTAGVSFVEPWAGDGRCRGAGQLPQQYQGRTPDVVVRTYVRFFIYVYEYWEGKVLLCVFPTSLYKEEGHFGRTYATCAVRHKVAHLWTQVYTLERGSLALVHTVASRMDGRTTCQRGSWEMSGGHPRSMLMT